MSKTQFTAQEELLEVYNIERCPECRCSTGDDTVYKDFSNKNIIVCSQCVYEWHTEGLAKVKVIELEANLPTDFTIEYWYDNPQEMPESEQEHVIEMLGQGYVGGELNCVMPDGDTENRGWWKIIKQEKAR